MQATLKLNMLELLAANVFASTETTRYYLGGVHIRSDGKRVIIESSDDHRAIQFAHDIEAEVCDVIIPRTFLKDIKPIKGLDEATLEIDGRKLQITYGAIYSCKAVEGNFPDIDRVYWNKGTNWEESREPVSDVGYNPAYMADFGKVNKILGGKPSTPIKFTFKDQRSPALVTPANEKVPHYEALLMPVRV